MPPVAGAGAGADAVVAGAAPGVAGGAVVVLGAGFGGVCAPA